MTERVTQPIQPRLIKDTLPDQYHRRKESPPVLPIDEQFKNIPGETFSQKRKYVDGGEEAIEVRHNNVTIYQPYIYETIGKQEGIPVENRIASRYAQVATADGKEAWFEILGLPNRDSLLHVRYLTQPQLHLILGDVRSKDSAVMHEYLTAPREDTALIRMVETNEIPLFSPHERETDPSRLSKAATDLAKELLQQQFNPNQHSPNQEDIEMSLAEQTTFEELVTAPNMVRIGKPQRIDAMLDNSHARTLYVYPTISFDGNVYRIISNKLFEVQDLSTADSSKEIIVRTDFLCGCQKFGEGALNHSCGHELLGSLKGIITPSDQDGQATDPTIVIAWGGVDANGNGSVMHSIKEGNRQDIGLGVQKSRRIAALQEIPAADHRAYRQLAEVLWAGAYMAGAESIRFNTANTSKIHALRREATNMATVLGEEHIRVAPDAHAHNSVSPDVRRREEDERQAVQQRFASLPH